jgi:hypothetical protein
MLCLVVLAAPSEAAQKTKASNNGASLEERCRTMVGKEVGEGIMRSGINRNQVQLWSDCMMGMPHAR